MSKLTFPLFLTAQLVCQAQLCEPSPQVRDALKEAAHGKANLSERSDAIRAVLREFPDDVWVHRAYQDTFRQGPVYRQEIIDGYKELLAKHPNDPEFLYLSGRTLVGTKTPEAIAAFDQALAKDPNYEPARLSLIEIYRAPNFKDPDKAQANLETWMEACPTQFDGFHDLERMDNSDFTKRSVARMRSMIESRNDDTALSHYQVLWRLEFQMHPAPEYPQVKENIRKDLARLRELDAAGKPYVMPSLREGYKLVDDKEGLAWVNEKSPAKSAPAGNAAMDAYQEWQKAHPVAQPKSGQTFDMDAFKARNKALLEVTAQWIQKWPDEFFVWSQRLTAIQMNRETPDAEVERAAEGLRKATKPSNGPNWKFQLASIYLQRNMHLSEIPGMVKAALDDLDKAPAPPSSDLYPQPSGMSMQGMRLMTRTQGLNTLIDAYQQTDHPDKALEALADLRKILDESKPGDSANTFEKQNWPRMDGMYWDKMAQVAEKQGHKLDALTFYQNEIRAMAFPGNQDYLKKKAKVLWTDLGGTDAAWTAWLARIEPAKPVVAANIRTEWEKMNKPLPEMDLTDMSGKTWRLADIKGKTTLINLWATWCGPCKMELPQLQRLYDKLKDRPDIRIITLNTDDNPGLIESFLKENKYTFPVLPARAYVDKIVPSLSIPRNWIVDQQAVLKLESVGYGANDKWLDNMTETLEKAK